MVTGKFSTGYMKSVVDKGVNPSIAPPSLFVKPTSTDHTTEDQIRF